MTISKIRVGGIDHDLRAKYLETTPSSEAKSVEFITRTTTEDATVATIQKIYGNTIKWNQLIQNGNFANGTTGWTLGGTGTATVSNGVLTYTAASGNTMINQSVTIYKDRKYYISFIINSPTTGYVGYFASPTQWFGSLTNSDINKDFRFSTIIKAGSNKATAFFGSYGTSSGSSYKLSNIWIVDLTDIYGAGNEPTLAAFEAAFPVKYASYKASGLVNVTAGVQAADSGGNVLGGTALVISSLKGKLSGSGTSVTIFPNGMQSNGTTRDEVDGTTATKKIADDNSVLVTPQQYILDTTLQMQYPVATGGTESINPPDPSLSAPIKMDVIYGNAADTISNLPANYISVDSMKEFLAALGTQMNGTWAMQYSGGKYTFTFTSN